MEKNTSETLYSLKFAERVRSVELGPGSRRAELGSWSSQEHLEVRGPSQACLWPDFLLARGQEGGQGGEVSLELRGGEDAQGSGLNLSPKSAASLGQVFLPGLRGTCRGISWLEVGGVQAGTQVLNSN